MDMIDALDRCCWQKGGDADMSFVCFDFNKLKGESCVRKDLDEKRKYIQFDCTDKAVEDIAANLSYISNILMFDNPCDQLCGYGLLHDCKDMSPVFYIDYKSKDRVKVYRGDVVVFTKDGRVYTYTSDAFTALYKKDYHKCYRGGSIDMPSSYLNAFFTDPTITSLSFGGCTYKAPTYKEKYKSYQIERVIISGPATIVFFSDKTKIVVKCSEGETFDLEKALALAIARKALGNKGSYLNFIKDGMKKVEYIDIKED